MSHYNVAVIRGDGIGIEVIEEGIKVLDAVGHEYGISWTWNEYPWGSEFYREHGVVMPSDALDTLAESDVIFLGRSWASRLPGPHNSRRTAASYSPEFRPVRVRAAKRAVRGHRLPG